ncbi:MAG: hypothetical protein V3V78_02290 [Candidatus Woesearchaeota archaeon]
MPGIAWKEFYRTAKDIGYILNIPNSQDRAEFRQGVRERYGLDPKENQIRAVYVFGCGEKTGYNFFADNKQLEQEKSKLTEIAEKVAEGRERIGSGVCHHHILPHEIVGYEGFTTGIIGFVDPFKYDKLVVVFYKKCPEEMKNGNNAELAR